MSRKNKMKTNHFSSVLETEDISCALMPQSRIIKSIPVDMIDEDPGQPRTNDNEGFSEESIQELAKSIKIHGLQSPISVHRNGDRFMLNWGARRLRATKVNGSDAIDAIIEDKCVASGQVVENLQRRQLNSMEMAMYIKRELDAGSSKSQIANGLGKKGSFVSVHLALIDMPKPLSELWDKGGVKDVRVASDLRKIYAKDPDRFREWSSSFVGVATRETAKSLALWIRSRAEESSAASKIEQGTASGPPVEDSSSNLAALNSEGEGDEAGKVKRLKRSPEDMAPKKQRLTGEVASPQGPPRQIEAQKREPISTSSHGDVGKPTVFVDARGMEGELLLDRKGEGGCCWMKVADDIVSVDVEGLRVVRVLWSV